MDNCTLYEAHKELKMGIRIWKEMFKELIQGRDLIWRLFMRNLLAKYKQSVLGYVWIIIMPFIAIGTFVFLNKAGIVHISKTDMPYPLFALIGLTVWQLFATGISAGTNSLVAAGGMIGKINFPREVLVFSSMAQTLFEFLIKCGLIFICFFIFKFIPSWAIVLFPLVLMPTLILTIGLSLMLSLINGVLRDTANIVVLGTTFLMFLTPVLYPIPDASDKFIFFKLNILMPLINAPRDLIMYGYIKNPVDFYAASGVSVLLFLISWRIFHLTETKIPERL